MATTKVDVNLISATGTASSSTFLRGDSSWTAPTGGLVFISSTDISSAATFEFTAVDASSYDGYGFFLKDVVPATDQVKLYCRTSTDGGSSFDNGASDYMWGGDFVGAYNVDAADAQINLHGSVAAANYAVGSDANENGCSGWIWFHGPHLTGYSTVLSHLATHTTLPSYLPAHCCGVRKEAADVDGMQLLYSSGAIESGTITVYGLVNA